MGGGGVETLSRILTSMLSLMTRLRKADIHTFVCEERKLYHNYSMSPIPVVGKHRAAARCRSARGSVLGRVFFQIKCFKAFSLL